MCFLLVKVIGKRVSVFGRVSVYPQEGVCVSSGGCLCIFGRVSVYLWEGVQNTPTPSRRYTDTCPKIHRHPPEDTQTPSRRYTDTLPKTDTLLPITLTNGS